MRLTGVIYFWPAFILDCLAVVAYKKNQRNDISGTSRLLKGNWPWGYPVMSLSIHALPGRGFIHSIVGVLLPRLIVLVGLTRDCRQPLRYAAGHVFCLRWLLV